MYRYYQNRLDRVYKASPRLVIGDDAKIVFMSDCHRGCGNLSDDYAKNQSICYAALRSYFNNGYDYVEIGDGDELWENKRFSAIVSMHADVFSLLGRFYSQQRFVMLYGNHDLAKKRGPELMQADDGLRISGPATLLPGLTAIEGLVLHYKPAGLDLFIVHGHQADFFNDRLWRLARFLVRHIWRPLELVGFSDPKSAAKNNKVKEKVERRLDGWATARGVGVIAGHTHRAVFPEPSAGLYFNDGSCVHPWRVTAVEITGGAIALVGWRQKTRDDGTVYIGKDTIAGPAPLRAYLKKSRLRSRPDGV